MWGGSHGTPAPSCIGDHDTTLLVTAAAHIALPEGVPGLLSRLAAISHYRDMIYWSTTRQVWRPLVTEAKAIGSDDKERDGDFTLDELKSSEGVRFRQEENTPAGSVIYRMRIDESVPNRLAVNLINEKPAYFLMIPLFDSGAYRIHYEIRRKQDEDWDYSAEIRLLGGISLPFEGNRGPSYANRAEAAFRFMLGLSKDAAPPIAP